MNPKEIRKPVNSNAALNKIVNQKVCKKSKYNHKPIIFDEEKFDNETNRSAKFLLFNHLTILSIALDRPSNISAGTEMLNNNNNSSIDMFE